MNSRWWYALAFGALLVSIGVLLSFQSFSPHIANEQKGTSVGVGQSKPPDIISQMPTGVILPSGSPVRVSQVIDGDTVQTVTGETIRYLGVNSPEKNQPFYEEAFSQNKRFVEGKTIALRFDIEKKDRYGRTLAYVYAENLLINVEMVRRGYAVSQTIQPNVLHQSEIVAAQKEARDACRGIWKSLCATASSGAAHKSCVTIGTIHADAKGNDNQNKNGEWAEFKNVCDALVNMKGWLVKDSSSSNVYRFATFALEAGKTVRLHSGCGTDTESELYWSCPEQKYAIWNNATDQAFLYNINGELVATYQY